MAVWVAILLNGQTVSAQAVEVPAEHGTISTLAGPGFCSEEATPDAASLDVRGIAVGGSGEVSFETGRPEEGIIGRVDAEGRASSFRLGIPSLSGPRFASDGANLLVAGPARVSQFATGLITVAGDPTPSGDRPGATSGGDKGPAIAARFTKIEGIATDEKGNLFVAERLDKADQTLRIRYVNRTNETQPVYPETSHQINVLPGTIDSIAPSAATTTSTGALLKGVLTGMAATSSKLYLGLYVPRRGAAPPRSLIGVLNLGGRALSAHGHTLEPASVTSIAGGKLGFGGDGGRGSAVRFSRMGGIAVDQTGNLLVADQGNNRIRNVDPNGIVTTLAGAGPVGRGRGGFNGNEKLATKTRLNRPHDVKVGPDGRVFFSDRGNRQIRFIDQTGVVHASFGNGSTLSWRCSTSTKQRDRQDPLEGPKPGNPSNLAVGSRGEIYYQNGLLGQVGALGPSGQVGTVVSQARVCNSRGSYRIRKESSKQTKGLVAIATHNKGGLYLGGGDSVAFYNLAGKPKTINGIKVPEYAVKTILQDFDRAAPPPDRPVSSQYAGIRFMATDRRGGLFIASGNQLIRVDPSGKVERVAGGRKPGPGQCCINPTGIATDRSGNLYIADSLARRVWFVNRGSAPVVNQGQAVAPGEFRAIVGTGLPGFGGDGGPALEAQLQSPQGLALDHFGNLYIADDQEHSIRKVDRNGTISTVAGTGSPAFNGDGLKGNLTSLNAPTAVAVDDCGNLLIADTKNDRIRRLNLKVCENASAIKRSVRSIGPSRSPLFVTAPPFSPEFF